MTGRHVHVYGSWRASDFNNLAVAPHSEEGVPILLFKRSCRCGATIEQYIKLEKGQ